MYDQEVLLFLDDQQYLKKKPRLSLEHVKCSVRVIPKPQCSLMAPFIQETNTVTAMCSQAISFAPLKSKFRYSVTRLPHLG